MLVHRVSACAVVQTEANVSRWRVIYFGIPAQFAEKSGQSAWIAIVPTDPRGIIGRYAVTTMETWLKLKDR